MARPTAPPIGDEPRVCDICQKPFPKTKGLNRHQRDVHPTGARLICGYPECHKTSFKCKRSQKAHTDKQHAGNEFSILRPEEQSANGHATDLPDLHAHTAPTTRQLDNAMSTVYDHMSPLVDMAHSSAIPNADVRLTVHHADNSPITLQNTYDGNDVTFDTDHQFLSGLDPSMWTIGDGSLGSFEGFMNGWPDQHAS